ncbi:MAG: hypothetical protein IH851_13525, partial [Armatimonadetes bacterium]|nr:hypothetical protein [Armatimonadota bacterium]
SEDATGFLIRQNLNMGLFGGLSLTADYQDVGSKFSAFNMLQSAGVDAGGAKQLEKEKGIKRMGFGLSGEIAGGLSLSNSFRSIADGSGRIEYHDYSVNSGAVDAYYNARTIDTGFSRFKDIAEEDRKQLKKERGIARTGLGGALRLGLGSLKFDQNIIEDESGGIFRRSYQFQAPWLSAALSQQFISKEFTRTNDLVEKERKQWGKERGFSRNDITVGIPKDAENLLASFEQKTIRYDGKGFRSNALKYLGSGFGVQYWARSTDADFARLGDLTQAERDAMILDTLRMYDPNAKVGSKDRAAMVRENGLSREFLGVTAAPWEGAALRFDALRIDAGQGGIGQTRLGLETGGLNFDYRRQTLDSAFTRMLDLLPGERKLYGNQIGFDRTDLSLDWKVGPNQSFGFDQLKVGSAEGGAERLKAYIKGPGYEVRGATRRVDQGFDRAGDINDPEKNFLSQLVGFNQYDLSLKFDLIKNLSVEGSFYDSDNGDDALRRLKRHGSVVYTPDDHTRLSVRMDNHRFGGLSGLLFANDLMSIEGFRDFGRFGKLTVRREEERYGGEESEAPDRETHYAKFETQLGPNTDFSTEQVRTQFKDGGFENLQAYRFGWQVNSRLGLNMTEIMVDRDGEKPDKRSRSFGFEYDFGNNLKLGYTFNGELDSTGRGKSSYEFNMPEGQVGGFTVGGQYNEKRTKQSGDERTNALGRFSVSHEKPFAFGPLKDINVSFGYNSKTDGGVWKKENKVADFSARLFGSEIGASYSHLILPGEQRAADRTFSFNYDPTGEKPLQLGLKYKVRTLPGGVTQVIRDFDVAYRVGDQFNLSHTVDSLPEKAQKNAPLGSVAQPTMARTWAIDWTPNESSSLKFAFQDLMNLSQKTLARRTNVTLSLFNDTDSPLRLTYGVEQSERPSYGRRTRHMYEVAFDQKAGPNQTFSVIAGTVNWQHGIVEGQYWNSWTFRLDYQLRF